ncbi:MAG: transglutaminase-like domain-containing protein [Bryobacteraceae bacterium]
MNHLRHILEEDPPKGRLDKAALEIASIQTPGLEAEPYLDRMNELAANLGDRLRNFNDGREFVEVAQRYLFEELGYGGNENDFFNARNSCLDQVLTHKLGIPITLSVFYMEIARRLAMPVFGIGLPRHFIVQFDDERYNTYVDPYHGGKAITMADCFALAGAKIADPVLLRRASKKDIAMRMLQNLRAAYLRDKDWPRAAVTLDWLILGAPGIAHWYKQRATLRLELNRKQDARRDLERYLELEPDATDRDQIEQQLRAIHTWMARNN